MSKSQGIAICGAMFSLIGIRAIAHHDIVPAIAMFVLAAACGLRAHRELNRHPN